MKINVTQKIELSIDEANTIAIKHLQQILDFEIRTTLDVGEFYKITDDYEVNTWDIYPPSGNILNSRRVGDLSENEIQIFNIINFLKERSETL